MYDEHRCVEEKKNAYYVHGQPHLLMRSERRRRRTKQREATPLIAALASKPRRYNKKFLAEITHKKAELRMSPNKALVTM